MAQVAGLLVLMALAGYASTFMFSYDRILNPPVRGRFDRGGFVALDPAGDAADPDRPANLVSDEHGPGSLPGSLG